MPPGPGVFQIDSFLRVSLTESRCLFALGPSSSPSNFFPMLFIRSAVLSCFILSHILPQIVFFPCYPVAGKSSYIISLLSGEIFSLFSNVLFCLSYFILCRHLFILFFFSHYPLICDLELYCLFYSCFLFWFQYISCFSSVLSFLLVVVDFSSTFPGVFPVQVLSFCSCSFGGLWFYHILISLPDFVCC